MNQILYIQKSKNGNSLEINSILKIFAIAIIILGVILIGKGVYGIVALSNKGQEPVVATKEINGKLQINVTHNKAIDKIIYSWNGKEEIVMQGRGQTNILETIELPVGTNMLNLKIIDIDLTKVDFIEEGISYFNELIDQFMLIYNS